MQGPAGRAKSCRPGSGRCRHPFAALRACELGRCPLPFLTLPYRTQAAVAHARTPMQMMAARQQLMAAKSRQDVERMQFNCF